MQYADDTPQDLLGGSAQDVAHQALVTKAQQGDEDALRELLLTHQDQLLIYIRTKLGDRLQAHICAEDLLQETLIHANRDLPRCEAREKAQFAAWLRAIANHRLQDAAKHMMRKKRGGDMNRVEGAPGGMTRSAVDMVHALSAHVSSPSRMLAKEELGNVLRVAVACLQEDQRLAIMMHYVDGVAVAEIAEKMERTPAAIRGLIHRGLEAMRNGLDRSAIWLSTR